MDVLELFVLSSQNNATFLINDLVKTRLLVKVCLLFYSSILKNFKLKFGNIVKSSYICSQTTIDSNGKHQYGTE